MSSFVTSLLLNIFLLLNNYRWEIWCYTKPLEDVFQLTRKDVVDMKIMRGLCENGIPFNVLRNPQFVEMVTAINNGPKCYKPPSSEKARTILWDECKRCVDKDLAPIKDTWYHHGVSIVSDGWSNVRHKPLINVLVVHNRAVVFMYACRRLFQCRKIRGCYC